MSTYFCDLHQKYDRSLLYGWRLTLNLKEKSLAPKLSACFHMINKLHARTCIYLKNQGDSFLSSLLFSIASNHAISMQETSQDAQVFLCMFSKIM